MPQVGKKGKNLDIETARAFHPLLFPNRYKGLHGGRGSGKSHFFGELAIETNFLKPYRGVCIREVQNSLRESVRQLLIDKIQKFGLGDFFEVTEGEIRGKNGSLIVFKGMQSYNAETIKSLEAFDWAWVEEAQTLSAQSLRMLRPTIRKEYADGTRSELWFSWNPRNDTDPVDKLFRAGKKLPDSICVEANYQENPWFPNVLSEEMEHDYEVDPEMAEHVWGGGYEIISEGAYFARDIALADKENRAGFFPYDPDLPVSTAWDLGVDDYTAIWFMQENGKQVRAIDYHEFSGVGAEQIIEEALPELLKDKERTAQQMGMIKREKPFKYDKHFLPHDVMVREWGAGARSRFQTLTELGMPMGSIHVGVATPPEERIAASRRLLPFMRFHRNEGPEIGVNFGVKRLRAYKRRLNQTSQQYVGPLKDGNDHGSDAFGEYAINCRLSAPVKTAKKKTRDSYAVVKGRSSVNQNDGAFS